MKIDKWRLKKALSIPFLLLGLYLFIRLMLYQRTGYFSPFGYIGGTWYGNALFFFLLGLDFMLFLFGWKWLLEKDEHPRRFKI